jgi:hypothetical protein
MRLRINRRKDGGPILDISGTRGRKTASLSIIGLNIGVIFLCKRYKKNTDVRFFND